MMKKKRHKKMEEQRKSRKQGRVSNEYLRNKLPRLKDVIGGLVLHEGKLHITPTLKKSDYEMYVSKRSSRLIYDDDGVVVGLRELDLVRENHFYNTQEERTYRPFIRDDLMEPTDTAIKLLIYKKDIEISSSRYKGESCLGTGNIKITKEKELLNVKLEIPEPSADAVLKEETETEVEEADYEEINKGRYRGKRGKIKELSKIASNRLKFTLRNALCKFNCFVTLTYPDKYPENGKVCKKHLNTFLTHLRKDYKGIKYVWFMEFQDRGAPHFHLLLSCGIPGAIYTSPLWYRIVNSGDTKHLFAGTNVTMFKSEDEVIKYATSYAKKATQKATPKAFKETGRFWGSSRHLCESIAELEDISIRQLQELRTCYMEVFEGKGRKDCMNGYIWNGYEYGPALCFDYYECHLRPLIAEVCDLSDPTEMSRHQDWLEQFRKLKKTVKDSSRMWKDIDEAAAEAYYRKDVLRLEKDRYGNYKHSTASAYEGFKTHKRYASKEVDPYESGEWDRESALTESEITLEEWSEWLRWLSLRMTLSWEERFKPLYKASLHVHVHLCKDGKIVKRKFIPRSDEVKVLNKKWGLMCKEEVTFEEKV